MFVKFYLTIPSKVDLIKHEKGVFAFITWVINKAIEIINKNY